MGRRSLLVLLGCSAGALLVPAGHAKRVFYASPEPSSSQPGLQACLDALDRPGDECRLRRGRYRAPSAAQPFTLRGKHGTAGVPMVIAPAEGVAPGDVIFDGTVPITGWQIDSVRGPASEGGGGSVMSMYRTVLPQPAWQLFDSSGEMQVPARWPDAFFHDKTVFQGPEHWAHSSTGVHHVNGHTGLLIDSGVCPSPDDCCSFCNDNGLASSGINATGALAFLNLWSCDTGIERIAHHEPGTNDLHYGASWINQW